MDTKEYENRHQRTTKVLRIIGWPLIIVGAACFVIGLISFFQAFASFSSGEMKIPYLFFLCFIGVPLSGAGIVCLSLGYRRKVMDYTASQVAPVAKDFTNYMLDGTGDSIAKVANKIDIFKDKTVEGVTANKCAKCGFMNPADAKFCAKCGAPITKKCPECGAENDDGAHYCNSCGKPLN